VKERPGYGSTLLFGIDCATYHDSLCHLRGLKGLAGRVSVVESCVMASARAFRSEISMMFRDPLVRGSFEPFFQTRTSFQERCPNSLAACNEKELVAHRSTIRGARQLQLRRSLVTTTLHHCLLSLLLNWGLPLHRYHPLRTEI
jgi:hypothetical protein